MKFNAAVDQYVRDQQMYGAFRSPNTERAYRYVLDRHSDDISNRDPSKVGRDDIKRTLRRWTHPNTQHHSHSVLIAFYDWAMEEGIRKDNPARQVRRTRIRKAQTYRLTKGECVQLLDACRTPRDRFAVHIGLMAGLRNQELRGLQPRHFSRPGWVHVTADIGKGGKERWVPVIPELEPVVAEVFEHVPDDGYLLCARRTLNPPRNDKFREFWQRPCSQQALWKLVKDLGVQAGIAAPLYPHLLRHAFGDHIARYAGLRAAQALLGHEDVSTTQGTYVGEVSLDELAVSVHGFAYRTATPSVTPRNVAPRHG